MQDGAAGALGAAAGPPPAGSGGTDPTAAPCPAGRQHQTPVVSPSVCALLRGTDTGGPRRPLSQGSPSFEGTSCSLGSSLSPANICEKLEEAAEKAGDDSLAPSSAGKLQLLPQGLTCPPAVSTITNKAFFFFPAYTFPHPTTAKGKHQRLLLCPWVPSEQFYGEALTASSDKTPNPVLTACPCLWGCCQVRRDFPLFPCPSQPILLEHGPGAAVPQLLGTPLLREVTPELLEPCQAVTGRFALLLLPGSFTNQGLLKNSL